MHNGGMALLVVLLKNASFVLLRVAAHGVGKQSQEPLALPHRPSPFEFRSRCRWRTRLSRPITPSQRHPCLCVPGVT